MYCNCYYCTGTTKSDRIAIKENIADRELFFGIEEFETRYEDMP